MENINQKLLDIIQYDFPIDKKPYSSIGKLLGIDEEEVIERIKSLKDQGIIRRVGGIFDSRKLGYKSLLCAMKAAEEDIDGIAAYLNQYPGITHNYKRNHEYSLWFTLIADSDARKNSLLEEIEKNTGYEVYQFPANNIYKLRAVFKIPKGGEEDAE